MTNYIKLLKLEGHEEGGYFALNYKSTDKVLIADEEKSALERSAGSSIYFLLVKQGYSALHRLKSDEMWHYYDGGSPIDIYVIDLEGRLNIHTLGNPGVTANASFQVLVKAGSWFAAEVRDKSSFDLIGCMVTPGFEYHDFELADRNALAREHPEHSTLINRLTRPLAKPWTNPVMKYATLGFRDWPVFAL